MHQPARVDANFIHWNMNALMSYEGVTPRVRACDHVLYQYGTGVVCRIFRSRSFLTDFNLY